jgi:hypothetical protein
VIEIYAITDHLGPPLPTIAPLQLVASRGLAAVCAPARDQEEVTPDELWRHEEVVEALMETRDVLPVRYGTRVADEQAAARVLEERHSHLVRALDGVRGAAEVSLRVIMAANASEPASGSDYLRAKARREAAAQAVDEPLSAVARRSVRRPTTAPSELLRAAYLTDRAEVEAFARLVARLQEETPELRLLCTGPWPPYSFAQ